MAKEADQIPKIDTSFLTAANNPPRTKIVKYSRKDNYLGNQDIPDIQKKEKESNDSAEKKQTSHHFNISKLVAEIGEKRSFHFLRLLEIADLNDGLIHKSLSEMGILLGVKKQAVVKLCKVLEAKGFIKIHREFDGKTRTSRLYKIVDYNTKDKS